jgi:hypothetical protein
MVGLRFLGGSGMWMRGYVKLQRADLDIYLVEICISSLDAFMRADIKDYDQYVFTVISKIVNEGQDSSTTLQQSTGIPVSIILHILDLLEDRGLLQSVGPAGFPVKKIITVSAGLRRMLR